MARDSKRLAVQFASRPSSYFVIELIMQADGAQMVSTRQKWKIG
jgi:hypothetical protein